MDLFFIWTCFFSLHIFVYTTRQSRTWPKCIRIFFLAGWPSEHLYRSTLCHGLFLFLGFSWTSCVFVLHILSMILVYILLCVFLVTRY